MRLRLLNVFFIGFIVISVFSSCKKESDTVNPEISVLLPYENQIFQVPAEIDVKATITDNNNLEFIRVVLMNEDFNSVLPSKVVYPDGNYFTLDINYDVSAITLVTGNYFLQIKASDGENEKNSFINVFLNEIPKELIGYVVTLEKSNTIEVKWVDPLLNQSSFFSLSNDYSDSELSSAWQQIFFSGPEAPGFQAYDLNSKQLLWNESAGPGMLMSQGDHILMGDELVFVGYEKFVRGYNPDGIIKFATPLNEYTKTGIILDAKSLVLVEEDDEASGKKFLSSYYTVSGVLESKTEIDFDIVFMHYVSENIVFITGNRNRKGVIGYYNPVTHRISEPHDPFEAEIYTGFTVNNDNWLLGADSGLYWYRYSNNSLIQLLSTGPVNDVAYNPLSDEFITAIGNEIIVFTFPLAVQQAQIVLEAKVNEVHLWYNK